MCSFAVNEGSDDGPGVVDTISASAERTGNINDAEGATYVEKPVLSLAVAEDANDAPSVVDGIWKSESGCPRYIDGGEAAADVEETVGYFFAVVEPSNDVPDVVDAIGVSAEGTGNTNCAERALYVEETLFAAESVTAEESNDLPCIVDATWGMVNTLETSIAPKVPPTSRKPWLPGNPTKAHPTMCPALLMSFAKVEDAPGACSISAVLS